MNCIELLEKRQSCRNFTGQFVEHEKLEAMVKAGSLAPSACNSQPWSFIVVESPEMVKEVALCGQPMNMNPFLANAGAFIIVVEEFAKLKPVIATIMENQYFAGADIGAATVQLCMGAVEQGLGTCQIGLINRTRLRELLNIPEDKRIASFIAVGYPTDEKIRVKDRKPLEEIVKYV